LRDCNAVSGVTVGRGSFPYMSQVLNAEYEKSRPGRARNELICRQYPRQAIYREYLRRRTAMLHRSSTGIGNGKLKRLGKEGGSMRCPDESQFD